jgi:hypothetical protein
MTNEYAVARDAHTVAMRKFHKIRDAYRARAVGDSEFLAARSEYEAATKIFDEAFAKEDA